MLSLSLISYKQKKPRNQKQKENVRTLLIGSEEFVKLWENSLSRYGKIPKYCIDSLVVSCFKEQENKTLQEIQNFAKKVKNGTYKKIICDTGLEKKNLPYRIKRRLAELVLINICKLTTLEWEQFPPITLLIHKKNLKKEKKKDETFRKYKDLP